MTSFELRKKFLDFFEKKGHTIIPSASLIPENDPTAFFTTAGMHPLVPFLLGEKHPSGKRLASCQKCIRTGDIEDVGDDTHLTFFEMLGNWSLGDYWKEEAIKWSFEFLTEELKIPLEKLAISCFAGDKDAPRDEESAKIWESLGIKKERIAFLPKKDNWWGPAGQTGPCGPDTEMFYWKLNSVSAPEIFDPKNENWVEVWNDVFMQYVKDENGNYNSASQKNVDTGMGLERTLAVLNGKENIYETDLFEPIIKLIPTELEERKKRIIADHSRAINALIKDGIGPSNKEQGYVLRRLMRRIITYEYLIRPFLKNDEIFFIDKMLELISNNSSLVHSVFSEERNKFLETLEKGLKEFAKGTDPFILFTTYGFPIELTIELAKETGKSIDLNDFYKKMAEHQDLSRTASAGMFKGGLADVGEKAVKYHTATHLLLAALREILGNQVFQKGSNINGERLRFDFSYSGKITPEEIKKMEDIVNQKIKEDLPVVCEEMNLEEARGKGAMGMFENKYGEKVKVYSIGDFSREICGGPHVKKTSELGHFKIIKEESSGAGVRRIRAVLK